MSAALPPKALAPPHLPDAPKPEGSFGFERWYTLVRALDGATQLPLDALEGDSPPEPAPGQAFVFVEAAGRGLGSRSQLGTKALGQLPADVIIERFAVLPGSGGARVLVSTEPGAARSLGTALLPAGRRRWRLLAQILAHEPGRTLINRSGCPSILVLAKAQPNSHALAPLGTTYVAMAEGVPGPLAKRVVAIGSKHDSQRSILKQAMGSEAAALIAREQRALVELQGLGLAPDLLHSGGAGCSAWLLQSNVEGRRGPDSLDTRHAHFIGALAKERSGGLELDALPGYRQARILLNRPPQGTFQTSEWRALHGLKQALEKRFRRRQVPIAYGHGDFTPWNVRVSQNRLIAFDWEFAQARLPVGFDLLHHHLQVGALVRKGEPQALLHEARECLQRLNPGQGGMSQDEALGLYVLIISARDLTSELVCPPQHAQASWLRKARTEWAQRISARLSVSASQANSTSQAEEAA